MAARETHVSGYFWKQFCGRSDGEGSESPGKWPRMDEDSTEVQPITGTFLK